MSVVRKIRATSSALHQSVVFLLVLHVSVPWQVSVLFPFCPPCAVLLCGLSSFPMSRRVRLCPRRWSGSSPLQLDRIASFLVLSVSTFLYVSTFSTLSDVLEWFLSSPVWPDCVIFVSSVSTFLYVSTFSTLSDVLEWFLSSPVWPDCVIFVSSVSTFLYVSTFSTLSDVLEWFLSSPVWPDCVIFVSSVSTFLYVSTFSTLSDVLEWFLSSPVWPDCVIFVSYFRLVSFHFSLCRACLSCNNPPCRMGSSPLRLSTLSCHASLFSTSSENVNFGHFFCLWVSPTPSCSKFMHCGLVLLFVWLPASFWMVCRPPPLHHLFSRCCVIGFVQLLRLFLLARVSWKTASFCCVFPHLSSAFPRPPQYSVWVFCSGLPMCTSSFPSSNCLITSDSSNSIGQRTSFLPLSMTPSPLPIPWQFSRSSRVGKVSVLLVCARP